MLRAYAEEFNAVEVDATFYGTPPITTINRWIEATPPGFRFALKLPRSITHEKRLIDVEQELDHFFSRIALLQERLGVVLIQLPPDLAATALPAMEAMLARRPVTIPCAIEFRETSWFTRDIFARLEALDVAAVAVDSPHIPLAYARRVLQRPTSRLIYLRLLGTRDETLPFTHLTMDRLPELREWANNLQAGDSVEMQRFAFTSNFFEGFAPATARRLLNLLEIPHTPRVPIKQARLF